MLQFTVPQFIDVEDKIIGPITTRQFVIMLFGVVLMFICYKTLDFTTFIVLSVLIFCITGIIAFLKVNGMPMHFFILNFVQAVKRPVLRVWNKEDFLTEVNLDDDKIMVKDKFVPKQKLFNSSRLSELSLVVDTSGVYKGESKTYRQSDQNENTNNSNDMNI